MSGVDVLPLAAACLWLIAANLAAMLPARGRCSLRCVALMFTGVPLLGWATFSLGPVAGVLLLAAGATLLREQLVRAAQPFDDRSPE
ncbi:DUF2484 family protein [Limimaricola pyoseonensis]|uniref:DUF2484 family protein n=1 Tax=Limimaricola pyoseonensis TaxID=521013 RepID=A0A1G7DIZ7_9RHOB|nr:DUF2484 family protein [Limimaricola pyoseonensis]SDE51479.1 Protein of unknown function [Limimaricola pyoseonensis]